MTDHNNMEDLLKAIQMDYENVLLSESRGGKFRRLVAVMTITDDGHSLRFKVETDKGVEEVHGLQAAVRCYSRQS